MSDLGDLIVDSGPYIAGQVMPFRLADNGHPIITAAELNELRDELIELRELRTAAATAARDQCGCLGGLLDEWGDLPW